MSFTTSSLITAVLLRTENVSSADADNSPRRVRLLEYAQQEFSELWNLRPWGWSMDSETITIASGESSGALSTEFQTHGPEGGVWQATGTTNPRRLDEVSPQIIIGLQKSSLSISLHGVFAVFGVSGIVGTQLLQVAKCSGSTDFFSQFKKIPPTLVDSDAATSNLQQVPPSWHETVLLPGVQALSARSKGSKSLQDEYNSQKRRGLDRMLAQEDRRSSSVQQLGRPSDRRYY